MNESPLSHDENLEKADRIAYLIAGHIRGALTEPEKDELDEWIVESDENLELFEKLIDEDNIEMEMQKHLRMEKEKAEALAGVKETIGLKHKGSLHKIWPYMVAASVLVIAFSLYIFKNDNSERKNENSIAHTIKNDKNPGSDKAVLTLSDGRTIILDSTTAGVLANEGDITIKSGTNGEIIYDGQNDELKYNLVSTPRGGQYKLMLGDGTKVWLNAESSLKFPAGFATTVREVELRGEGYFEVAKNERTFKVTILAPSGDKGIVEVLGTHFNVNGYGDKETLQTTLLEGSVRVIKDGKHKVLKPGEKAFFNNEIKVVKADVNEEIAWKNGKFLFRDATIKSIGEQIKRWFDIDVEYEGKVLQHFNMEVSRDVPLSRLLELFEATDQVHFKLGEKKLIIKP